LTNAEAEKEACKIEPTKHIKVETEAETVCLRKYL